MQNSRTAEQQNSRTAEQQNTLTDFGFSPDVLTDRKTELLQLLGQIAPELLSDNQLNLDALKALLSDDYIAPSDEHYELSWVGKSAARREIQKSTSHTLKPFAGNPERAQHILIEGENLEVLRVLQKSYHKKVKMIYIDPPYNTGNDSFVYPDDYSETLDEYQRRTGEKNEQGYLNKQSFWKKNSKESGQYHSAWLSMMLPRLYLARNLLRDDGVIFISIDDNEQANLKLLCDEIFGAENFVSCFTWIKKRKGSHLSKTIRSMTEYVLCYAKNIVNIELFGEKAYSDKKQPLAKRTNISKMLHFPSGLVKTTLTDGTYVSGVYGEGTSSLRFVNEFEVKAGVVVKEIAVSGPFIWTQEKLDEELALGSEIHLSKQFGFNVLRSDQLDKIKRPSTLIDKVGTNEDAYEEAIELFGAENIMSYPKPSGFMKYLINSVTFFERQGMILDFFAGSGTTAHAVMELNAEDGGNRQSISVQMPELLEEKSEAYKAGYRTIADITRARIDKVIAKLKEQYPEKTEDLACANFSLAPSNFKIWQNDVSTVDELREQLELHQEAEQDLTKLQGSQKAMLTELLLKNGLGVMGVHAVSKAKVLDCGITIHRVFMEDDKHLWLCFETYQEELKDEIVAARPAQVMLLNSCFIGDKADEQLSNLRLELASLEIGLLVI